LAIGSWQLAIKRIFITLAQSVKRKVQSYNSKRKANKNSKCKSQNAK